MIMIMIFLLSAEETMGTTRYEIQMGTNSGTTWPSSFLMRFSSMAFATSGVLLFKYHMSRKCIERGREANLFCTARMFKSQSKSFEQCRGSLRVRRGDITNKTLNW